ncbi:hypothetical protein O0I10_000624 [Lichtheimia ornata]|uniref:C2H2-type domain-containing protein n=1 Tax=Lichtheimia ornata TaxID=688661 RepID=A0AAD7Y403_9FUNG|nr:uncharacterized protein O0I10_000624 [Lichtheimia ornata]KAJ8663385.1 hypothetical protein O0I10_000624 [Lichtheimia ornata]
MSSDYHHHHQSGKKRHQCSVCQKKFGRPSALLTHMYTHTGERPFKCHVQGCGRDFTVQSNLRRHLKVHSPSPSPRRRLSAQMRYQFLQELMEKRERSFMTTTTSSCTAKYHYPSTETLPTQNDHQDVSSSLSSSPIISPSPSSSPRFTRPFYECNDVVDKWLNNNNNNNPPSSNVNHHEFSTHQSNPSITQQPETTLPFILLQYPRGHNIHF